MVHAVYWTIGRHLGDLIWYCVPIVPIVLIVWWIRRKLRRHHK